MFADTQSIASFLSNFHKTDRAWLLDNSIHHHFLAAQAIDHDADCASQLHLVLEGVVGVYQNPGPGPRSLLAHLGPGELLGETGWLTGKPTTDQLVVEQPAILMSWPRPSLEDRLSREPAFASVFYRTIASSCIRKVMGQVRTEKACTPEAPRSSAGDMTRGDDQFAALNERVRSFKALIARADRAALKNNGEVPSSLWSEALQTFQSLMAAFEQAMGLSSTHPPELKEFLGTELQREFLPYLSLTDTADRFYSKPRGYAGDYLTIANIYEDRPGGSGRVGPLIDACFLATPAAAAVRNRRKLLRAYISEGLARNGRDPTLVTSLACGPAQELFDIYAEIDDPARLRASLIDIDIQALAHVTEKAVVQGLDRFIEVFNHNLLYLATGRHKLDLPEQDLIYSIGLIDYFGDRFVVQLLDFIYGKLKPGGCVVLGNFHPRNPNKAFMDHILDWKLIHRDEPHMNRLLLQSKFGKVADTIRFEDEGVNLFAQCFKPVTSCSAAAPGDCGRSEVAPGL